MKHWFKLISCAVLVAAPTLVLATQPEAALDPLEPLPVEGELECSWSKLNAQELKTCQQKKQILAKMSKEQRVQWNKEVEKRQLERRVRRIERLID